MSAESLARSKRGLWALLLIVALGIGLRLLVWHWREFYGLGGDEQEYFNQALTLLRDHRYEELLLMRPPGYTVFLAACMYVFDSLVQRLRLIQVVISALTAIPIYGLTQLLFGQRRVAFLAALLTALSYTLATHATELLTETLFLFGFSIVLWLLLLANQPAERRSLPRLAHPVAPWLLAGLAGLLIGGLALLRSVALPLLPLGGLWLLLGTPTAFPWRDIRRWPWARLLAFGFAALLVIGPWTTRNALRYHALIVIDTTGAENLWLDNNPDGATASDPLGREAAKQELYALGDDRAERQRLASERGTQAILTHPAWFVAKSWGEAQKFFALEFFDELREKREIWVAPLDVWLRLLLGDGLWLVVLLAGVAGLWLAPSLASQNPHRASFRLSLQNPRWVFILWALYTFLTSLLFHVELRYRLPLFPVLLPYAAWALLSLPQLPRPAVWRLIGAGSTLAFAIALMLLNRPYLSESLMLAQKHAALSWGERMLTAGDAEQASRAAQSASRLDPDSALAQVLLARAALHTGDQVAALEAANQAIAVLPAHPLGHLLRGALLREQGQLDAARADLAFENHSLQDLQSWAWDAFADVEPPPSSLTLGDGLDLGWIREFARTFDGNQADVRWTTGSGEVQLSAAVTATTLQLELASGRPTDAPPVAVTVLVNGQALGQLQVASGWQTYQLPLESPNTPLVITLRSATFRPRDFDPTSSDGRTLGIMVRRIAVQ